MRDIHGNKERFIGWLLYVTRGLKKKWYRNCPLGDWIEESYQKR
ncbi:MAG: hypothetical protein ACTSRH_12535 [Promethearchaeota archaeon]